MKNSLKRNFINLGLFVLVFAFILVIATLYDLEISKLLTKNVLLPGEYYSISIIGRLIEYIGSAPIFLIGSFACLIFIHNIYSLKDKRKYLSLIFVVILIVLLEKFFGDTLKYYARHHEIEYILDYFYVDLILWGFALISSAVLLFFYRNV